MLLPRSLSSSWVRWCAAAVVTVFAGSALSGLAAPSSAMAKTTEAVVLNPQVVWFDGSGAGQPTELWTIDHPEAGTVRFNVHEPGYSVVFNHPVSFDLDVEALPILSLTYRGRGLQDDGQRNPNLLVFFNGCDKGDRPVIPMKGLVWDGQPHTVEVDLREALGDRRSPMKRFDLRIHAHEDAAADGAWFELVDLRFKPAASEADASTDTANEAIQAAEAPQQATDSPPVQVRVTDPAGQPIADAEVVLDPHLRDGVVAMKTDTEGRASVRATRATCHGGRSMLRVQAPGTAAVWYRRLADVSGDMELAVTLHPSMTLGGTVVDADGQPVANAVGELWMDGLRFSDRTGSPTHAARSMRVRTDTQGRWISAALPDDRNTRVRVRWMHPGFLDDRWGGQFSGEPAMADLRAGRGHQVLTKGVAVTGRVFGKDGQPLAGAHVAQGDDRFPSNAPPATRTDGEGRFAFAQTEPGPLVLTVKKAGHAPQLVQTTASEDMLPIEFHLGPASVFRFRVVDADGEPIEGASICPDTWLGFRTIPGRFHTGPDGYAQWEGPADPVEFDVFSSQEYAQQRGVTFAPNTPSGEPHVITLGKPLSIDLTVVDAQTGEPVTRFTPIPGIVWDQNGDRSPHFQRDNAQAHTSDDGVWSHRFGYPYPFRAIRVEADGYAPAMTELFAEDAGAVSVELRLEPAEGMAGTLLDPESRPVAGADVYLLYGSAHLQIQNGKVEHSHNVPAVRTDAAGRFSLPPQADAFRIVALHDAGYLDLDADAWAAADGQRLTLEPWATIRGTLRVGADLAPATKVGAWVQFDHRYEPRPPYHQLSATTDAEGRFTLDRVPAGAEGGVGRYLQVGPRSWGYDQGHRFALDAGETLEVELGGHGRPIVGQFAWPADAPRDIAFGHGHSGLSSQGRPPVAKTVIAQLKDKLLPGDAAKNEIAQLNQHRYHNFMVESDGRFRIENVEPGTYALTHQVSVPPAGNQCGFGDSIGTFHQIIEVPALPDGVAYLNEPLDLGTLEVTPLTAPPAVGDEAPAFDLPVLPAELTEAGDNKNPIDLAAQPKLGSDELLGKVTLLYFGASWCGPCHAEAPHLREIHATFGQDPRFAMATLSFDAQPTAAVAYAREKQFAWPQLFPAGGFQSDVAKAFGVRGIPSLWLIGPDGRVLANDLRGAATLPAVRNALDTIPVISAH